MSSKIAVTVLNCHIFIIKLLLNIFTQSGYISLAFKVISEPMSCLNNVFQSLKNHLSFASCQLLACGGVIQFFYGLIFRRRS